VKLEENFRSTQLILDAANGLIRHNTERREKQLVTSAGEGAPLEYRALADEHEEARFVARRVQEALLSGVPREEVAVFYRVGGLSRALETTFQERGIPFRVVGSVAFYQRREVKDLLAYLRVIHNPRDDVAVQRVINVPPRGVGKTSLGRLIERARGEGTSLLQAGEALLEERGLKGRGRAGVSAFLGLVTRLRRFADDAPAVVELLRHVLEETHYRDYLAKSEEQRDLDERLSNIEALMAAARDFDRRNPAPVVPPEPSAPPPGEPLPLFAALTAAPPPTGDGDASFDFGANAEAKADEGDASFDFGANADDEGPPGELPAPPGAEDVEDGLAGFLSHTALIGSAEETEEGTQERVSLMTIHAAKGLEFESVFVVGLEEGLFPHSRALEDGRGLEEERRLAYVAVTRAKRRLVLTRSDWRSYQGRSTPQRPSLFLLELPQATFAAGESPGEREVEAQGRVANAGYDDGHGAPDYGDYDGIDEPPWDDDALAQPPRRPPRAARPRPSRGSGRPAWAQALAGPGGARKKTPAAPRVSARPVERRGPTVPTPSSMEAQADLKVKDRVYHEHFGYGTITNITGREHRRRADVQFDEYGPKSLVLQYARMTRLEQ
jgi:DNA helicase-2/ATP-dependent DNA helicase PcrA